MKIIHISDLHLGQIIYQHYDRADEHDRFFRQLHDVCREESPDALIVTGDIFDIQQPSAGVWQQFTSRFVDIHLAFPNMRIIIIAGNHDSPSRLHSHKLVWKEAATEIVALAPPADALESDDGWEENFIVRLAGGYIIALPYMSSFRDEIISKLSEYVERENIDGKPVIMTGHLAVGGCDVTGHDFDIGNLRTISLERFGTGYDYLALGHIHKAQTLEKEPDNFKMERRSFPSPVARYAGSVLHVSCDENYPHSMSVVEIDRRRGDIVIRTVKIEQLRHFHVFDYSDRPEATAEKVLNELQKHVEEGGEGYFRFRFDRRLALPPDFTTLVYNILSATNDRLRYNPKIDWIGEVQSESEELSVPRFEIAELQQMTNPMDFIEKTRDQYEDIDIEQIRDAFIEIEEELKRMKEGDDKSPIIEKKRK